MDTTLVLAVSLGGCVFAAAWGLGWLMGRHLPAMVLHIAREAIAKGVR